MRTRELITEDLMRGLTEDHESYDDHISIACALRNGCTAYDILSMPELQFWPLTATWLERELKEIGETWKTPIYVK